MPCNDDPYDMAILGNGVSAWACAHAARRAGLSVAVLERRPDPGPPVGEHLPPEGISALSALGLAGLLDTPAHRPSPAVLSLWGGPVPVRLDLLMRPGGRALHVDRAVLGTDLKARAIAAGAEAIALRGRPRHGGSPGRWTLQVKTPGGGRYIAAGLLVDATGRAAALAQAMGAGVERHDTLTGIAAFLEDTPCTDGALLMESLADGWCYAAPLARDRLVAVFLTDAANLPRGQAARQAFAADRLRQSRLIAPRMAGGPAPDSRLRTVPAWSQITGPSLGPGWIAIGDAAMAFDPLASAGLTKALLDVRETVDAITDGRAEAFHTLARRRAARYAAYRRELAETYGRERRYHPARFWQARRAARAGQGGRAGTARQPVWG
ncbi:NAD(P)/FAD-dependent oxidoreductase [Eilatimonas milleporae]|uniref:Flavin-dependent dehydrogenase n=1 Tax=Eilatimonas milleporae TaxID=911205 RepID=A0A3M0CRF8_9PROT|nr:tryptophan 7-halogenase [Eilatimonas milleporae]RMB12134.1 flavin-dependent dehydrogenase [Eilatimonas milleporae]